MTEHPIEHKIARAKKVFARHGDAMLGDPTMTELLNRYRDAIGHTAATMRQSGLAPFCGSCATTGPGSCCSTHMEAWYDPMLLFMNCLLGCDLRESRRQPEDCFFQGPQGCQLRARYSFCVNFLCPSLTALLGRSRSQALLSVCGNELLAGWNLEQAIRRWFRAKHLPSDLFDQSLVTDPAPSGTPHPEARE